MTDESQNHQGFPTPEMGKFGTTGYDTPQNYGMNKPAEIRRLFIMTVVSFVLYLVPLSFILIVLLIPSAHEGVIVGLGLEGGSEADVDSIISFIFFTVAFVFFAVVVSYLLVLVGIKKRWGWSRVFGIVMAFFGIFYLLYNMLSAPSLLGIVLALLFIGVNAYWLVLAFNPKVVAWMSKKS